MAAVLAAVELLARVGLPLPDPRPILFVAVVYAAMAGGAPSAAGALLLTVAYAAYYFAGVWDGGPAAVPDAGPWARTGLYAITAPVMAGMVLLLRRQAVRRSRVVMEGALAEQRQRNDLATVRRDELNRAVLGSLPVQIAVLDADGRIVSTNAAWDRTAAAQPDIPPADGEAARDVIEGRRNAYSSELAVGGGDERRWFLVAVSPLEFDARAPAGGRRGAVVTRVDITERKQAEQSLRRRATELAGMARALKHSNDQLARANEQLDQFAYVTSHDLRAPLRGIANLSSWIEEDMGDRFTPEAHKQMELLRGRVHRMEAMIDGILEYSRAGRVRSPAAQVDVAALLAEVVDLLDPPAHFVIDVAPGMPVIVDERLRLQQVFMNLIGNAIKHHDAGKNPNKPRGVVRVACGNCGGDLESTDGGAGGDAPADQPSPAHGYYEFTVADDGPGIEPQYHGKIFVIFQTLESRDKVEGTGVGLALVKKIVESRGGTVGVESRPGEGTTFRFTWPKDGRAPSS